MQLTAGEQNASPQETPRQQNTKINIYLKIDSGVWDSVGQTGLRTEQDGTVIFHRMAFCIAS